MIKKTYSDKLLDPRWQKKRLHIFNRDNFSCCLCGDKETTLHVHHMTYSKGKDPWEYEDSNFRTNCQNCHLMYGDWHEMTEFSLIKSCVLEEFKGGKKYALLVSKDDECYIYFYRIDELKKEFNIYGMINTEEFSRLFDMMKGVGKCQG